jgi:hypothetical protein
MIEKMIGFQVAGGTRVTPRQSWGMVIPQARHHRLPQDRELSR